VRDVAAIMIKLMESNINHQRFIVCAENLPYSEVFNQIHDNFGKKRPSIKASIFLAAIVWRIEKIKALLTNTNPLITRETVIAAFQKVHFSNQKVKTALKHEFIPVNKSLETICKIYLLQRK
jgi:nucleoside-diphosphate-sugar epimerase